MSYSFTQTVTQTFTVTHAKHLASKVATDLKRMQRFYGSPSDSRIENFEAELVELLKKGYLAEVSYGFMKGEKWIEPTLVYTAQELASSNAADDDPGRVTPGADITGASFYSYLTYSQKYLNAPQDEKDNFEKISPVTRTSADKPGMEGYLMADKTYSSGGTSINRSYLKSY